MLKKYQIRMTAIALAIFGVALLGTAQSLDGFKQQGDSLAGFYQVTHRPTVIIAEEISSRIQYFPQFGEKTVAAMKAIAPIERLSQIAALKNAAGRPLLDQKQLILLAMFYNLKP
jgi:hypothetical protein